MFCMKSSFYPSGANKLKYGTLSGFPPFFVILLSPSNKGWAWDVTYPEIIYINNDDHEGMSYESI